MDIEAAFEKAKVYCDYQDRCHNEVRSKLIQWKVYGDTLEEVIVRLIEEGRLDEGRFAKSYARGKFRNNDWGRQKIVQGLKQKRIGNFLITKALLELDEEEYRTTLLRLANKKISEYGGTIKGPLLRKKVADYLIGKGYSYPEIEDALSSGLFGEDGIQ